MLYNPDPALSGTQEYSQYEKLASVYDACLASVYGYRRHLLQRTFKPSQTVIDNCNAAYAKALANAKAAGVRPPVLMQLLRY